MGNLDPQLFGDLIMLVAIVTPMIPVAWIVTDSSFRLDHEIERLRGPAN